MESTAVTSPEVRAAAVQKHVLALAYQPGKALLQTAFMLWMSGTSIQIFSIMMTGMALINPLKAIVTTNQTFKQFESEPSVDLRIPKLIFISLQFVAFAAAMYKTYTMGLLPVTSGDWTSYIPSQTFLESSTSPL